MRVEIFLAILGFCSASPSLDWDQIQPKNAYIQPKINVSTPALPRIIGGQEAEPHSRPYQVAIIIDYTKFCGGVLISRLFVLTAAHCIEGHVYFQIIFGAHNIRKEEDSQVIMTSMRAIIHPNYNPGNLNNDIGLIRLLFGVVLNDYVQTIPLAPEDSGDFPDTYPYVSGWGRVSGDNSGLTSNLHEVKVGTISNSVCDLYYAGNIVVNSTICTAGIGAVGGACDGDSGGPLVLDDMLIGIVSFTSSSGCENYPTGYARISSFRGWINQNTGL